MDGDTIQRTCAKCGQVKPERDGFYWTIKRNGTRRPQSHCKECSKAGVVAWQKANPDRKAASDRKQDQKPERKAKHRLRSLRAFEANRERELARLAAWTKANPERAREIKRRWVKANPEKNQEAMERYHAKPERKQYLRDAAKFRRTLRLGAGGGLVTDADWLLIVAKFGGRCCYCDAAGDLTQDHLDPISRGGLHVASNLVPACERCNKSKRAKAVEQFCPGRAAEIRRLACLPIDPPA